MPQRELAFRSVFISDVHLGSAGCQAESVRHFLHEVQCEYLYLVGDIIDIWVAAKSGKWKQEHTNVLRTILNKSNDGCIIRYTPGNHDEALRRINGVEWGNISINQSYSHETLEGKRLLVVHGDLFDRSVTAFKPLAHFGAWIYEVMTLVGTAFNILRRSPKPRRPGFSAKAKKMLKTQIERLTHFEERITADARQQGYDGVICGHIHKPRFAVHDDGGMYLNSGDWIEHCSAIVEHLDGRLELLFWADLIKYVPDPTTTTASNSSAPDGAEPTETETKNTAVTQTVGATQ